MSYYTMAMEFWGEVGLFMGVLPVLAVSVRGLTGAFARAMHCSSTDAVLSTR